MPEATIRVGRTKMPDEDLDAVMTDFIDACLVCSTVDDDDWSKVL